jgi:cobalt-precorrin-7 (C5)-methyltransferase
MLKAFSNGYNFMILSDIEQTLSQTANFLLDGGISKDSEVLVGEHIGYQNEILSLLSLSEVAANDFHWMSCMAVRTKHDSYDSKY